MQNIAVHLRTGVHARSHWTVCCLTTFLAIGLAATSGTALAQDSAAIARYEAWRGGAAFQKLVSFHAVGTISKGGLSGTVEISSEADGRLREQADLAAFKQDDVLNGNMGWSRTLSGTIAVLPAAEVADATRENALLYDGVLHGGSGAVLSAQPPETLDTALCDVVRVSYAGSSSTYDYLIASADGRLLAIRSFVAGAKRMTTFDDWRTIDGVRMPFVAHVLGELPNDASATTYTHIDVNPRFPVGLFAAPDKGSSAHYAKGASSSGWLPFEFFDRSRIFIPATVNGRAVAVMLDSGATSNVVDLRFAQSLGVKPEGAMTGQGAGGAATTAVLNGIDLTLGTLNFKHTTAVAVDLAGIELRLGHSLPMILGGEAFTECVVDIDFRHGRIAFRNPASFHPPAHAASVALTPMGESRVLGVQVEGRPASLLFDIGNAGALVLFPRFWDVPGFLDARRTSTNQIGGLGGSRVVKAAMVRSLSVGGTSFGNVPASLDGNLSALARSGRLDGNLGLPVYSRFRLIVDEPHDRVLFAAPVDEAHSFEVNHAGLTLQDTASGAQVLYVAPGSPAHTAGLKIGDVIVTIDGAPESHVRRSGQRIDGWLFGAPGRTLKVGLATGRTCLLTLGSYF